MQDLNKLKSDIKTEANRLGFNHFGIAPSLPVPQIDHYLAWVKAGYQASMGYLSREDTLAKRQDPRLILEDCQRLICLAMPYNRPQQELEEPPGGLGWISAYAVTRDYHEIIWEKLALLESYIQEQAGRTTLIKSYVDTGPVLERAYATAAGIGISGKNTLLLIKGTGSYFFLAEILTDLKLPVDQTFTQDLCGTCRRCIDACPTGCILPDRTLDAGRCISYLTIEHRGPIPDALKNQMGSWLFGCDVCQIVCPHNAWTPKQNLPLGEPILPEWLDLSPLFIMNEEEFRSGFKQTPLLRAKRQGLLRNAAIILGNQYFQPALPVLQQALVTEDDPGIHDACRWAIHKIQNRDI